MTWDECSTCDGPGPFQPIPIIGQVCSECLLRLERPVMLDGVVSGPTIRGLAESIDLEFKARSRRLLLHAREVCKGTR